MGSCQPDSLFDGCSIFYQREVPLFATLLLVGSRANAGLTFLRVMQPTDIDVVYAVHVVSGLML